MKTAALHVLFIVSIIMCIGCESKPKNQILSYPPIQATDTLKHQIFPTEEVFGSAMCMFITDSLLIIEDYFNRDTSIWGIHLKSHHTAKAYVPKGRGPGEVSNPSSNIQYCPKTNSFLVYDPNYKKIITYNYRSDQFIEQKLPVQDKIFQENFIQDIVRKDSMYICMGTGKLFTKNQRFLLTDNRFKYINHFEGYPEIAGISEKDISEIYQYGEEIHVKPDGSKLVFGSYIGGILEIFDLQHLPDSIPLVRRHLYYMPIYEKDKIGNVYLTEGTIYGFENIYVTDQAIYTLIYEPYNPSIIFPNKLIIYDWEGNWIKTYTLDCMVHALCIDEKSQTIYAMAFSEEESFHLVTFKL